MLIMYNSVIAQHESVQCTHCVSLSVFLFVCLSAPSTLCEYAICTAVFRELRFRAKKYLICFLCIFEPPIHMLKHKVKNSFTSPMFVYLDLEYIFQLIWICSLAQLKPVKYGETTYPQWSIALGWMVALLSILPFPIFAIIQLKKSKGNTLLQVCNYYFVDLVVV